MPIRVTKAHTLKIVFHPYPESKQLILDNVYEIKVEIYDKEERQIYPSEVKNTFLILRNALLSNNEISRTSWEEIVNIEMIFLFKKRINTGLFIAWTAAL